MDDAHDTKTYMKAVKDLISDIDNVHPLPPIAPQIAIKVHATQQNSPFKQLK